MAEWNLQIIEEVRTVTDLDVVNEMLRAEWFLLSIGAGQEQTGPHGFVPYFKYCLGRGSNPMAGVQ